MIVEEFNMAQVYVDAAIRALRTVRKAYEESTLPQEVVERRILHLESKIDYLKGLQLNPLVEPWINDVD